MHCVDAAPGIHTADADEVPVWSTHSTRTDRSLWRAPPVPVVISTRSDEAALARLSGGGFEVGILLTLAPPSSQTVAVGHVDVQYRIQGAAVWRVLAPLPGEIDRVRVPGVTVGEVYEIRLRAVSERHTASDWVSVSHLVTGPILPPPPPRNLLIDAISDGTRRIRWDPPGPLDVVGYRLRIAGDVAVAAWDTMTPMHEGLITSSPYETVDPLGAGIYWFGVRSVDASGLESVASYIRAELPPSRLGDALLWGCPSAAWPGTITHAGRSDDGADMIEGLGTYTWADLTTWAAWVSWGAGSGDDAAREIRYQPPAIDIGIVADVSIGWSGEITGTGRLEYRHRAAASPWSEWGAPSGSVRARYLELRWIITGDGTEVLTLDHLCYSILAPAATDRYHDLATSTHQRPDGGIGLPTTLAHVSDIDVTLQGVAAGTTWSLRSKSPLIIDIYSATGARIAPVIDLIVRGLR